MRPNLNRLGIGVQDLTEEKKQFLEREFGSDKVHVYSDSGWYGYAPLPLSGDSGTKP